MTLRERLDRYRFEPARVRDLACLRVAIVLVLLADALWPGSLAHQLRLTRVPDEWFVPIPAFKLLMLLFGWGARPDALMIIGVWMLAGVAGLFAFVGAYTRWSLAMFAVANMFLLAHSYSYGTLRHPEAAATIVLWMLIATPSGSVLSVDAMRARVAEDMAVVTPEGRVMRGFFAFREISRRPPALWPLVPLTYAPGSAWVGTRVYAWVAANRARRLCRDDACAVHHSAHGGKEGAGVGSVIDFGGSAS